MLEGSATSVTSYIEGRRLQAIERARQASAMLAERDITVKIIGSLAKGRFGRHSDVDFLFVSCPRKYKYAIEAKIEDIFKDIPFDVVYLEEIPEDRLDLFTKGAIDVDDLH
jgi:predicted nucleotidyltransferase